ncbi:cellulase family glycosylhydrolase [Phenylobacterium sp. LjRoot225]|uniref:glycoside hydrolase family 5 protein n=1 Tax=Phenylobacterium sp. LjRoot225 TaxID=3342285 RepID=UPI003ED0F049
MLTRRKTLAGGIAALAAAPQCARRADGAPLPGLRRGVNIHHMLNWPTHRGGQSSADYVWPPFATAPYQLAAETLAEIVARGFTFVRVTVAPSIFLAADAKRRAELARLVMSRVDRFLAAGLEVLVDLHPVRENPAYLPERLTAENFPEAREYVDVVKALARGLGQRSADHVAFELMNEPHPQDAGGAERWQAQQAGLYAAARQEAPDLALVVCGADWSSGRELTRLDLTPYRKGNVLFTFHYYSPHLFTHSGMPTAMPERYLEGLAWPPAPAQAGDVTQAALARIAMDAKLSPEERTSASAQAQRSLRKYFSEMGGEARVNRDFAEVAAWAAAQGVPASRVLVGEFGVYHRPGEPPAVRAARLAWLETVRRAAEARSFGWAIWVLQDASDHGRGGIGILPSGAVSGMDPGVVRALGLRSDPKVAGGGGGRPGAAAQNG